MTDLELYKTALDNAVLQLFLYRKYFGDLPSRAIVPPGMTETHAIQRLRDELLDRAQTAFE